MQRPNSLLVLVSILSACSVSGPTKTEVTPFGPVAPSPISTHAVQILQTQTESSNVPFTVPSGNPAFLDQIKMFDENHGWMIIGADDPSRRVLHTDDGGVSWNDMTPNGIAVAGSGIFFLDSQTAWIPAFTASNIPAIFHTTDAGRDWQPYQHLPFKDTTPDKSFSLQFVDSQNGWAFADQGIALSHYAFRLYQTTDGGVHWTQLMFAKALGLDEPSLPPGTFYVREDQGLEILDSSTIWFSGNRLDETTRAVTLQVSRDAGKTWSTVSLEIPKPASIPNDASVSYSLPVFINQQDGYLVVSYNNSPINPVQTISVMTLTHDAGDTWTASPNLINGESYGALHIDFISPTDAFFHCGDSLCVTHDGARTWASIPSNFSFAPVGGYEILQDLDFVNAQIGWAIIDQGGTNQLIKTSDGGKTWGILHP